MQIDRPRTFRLVAAAALAASALVASASPAAALDDRFRTYGPATIQGTTLPFRRSRVEGNYAGQSYSGDYIPVGTLDGRSIGPYAGLDTAEVWKRWSFLRRRGRRLDAPIYEALARAIGARPGALYAEDVLDAQVAADRPHLVPAIEAFVRAQRTDAAGRFVDVPIAFEVSNEPNVFPYLAPDLYAWYYLVWRKEILAALAQVNARRPANAQVRGEVMPAGLWMFEGLPGAITRALGTRASVGGIQLLAGVETDTRRYYEAFLASLRSERYAALGSGSYRAVSTTIRIPFIGSYTVTRSVFVPAAPQALIDRGALHFYPYTHKHAAYGEGNLTAHLATLRALSDLVAQSSRTGSVWLTELGHVNPFDDARATRDIMTPLCTWLKAGGAPAIERWYWFVAQGDDSKFKLLDQARGGMGGGLVTALRLSRALSAIPGIRVSTALTAADGRAIDDLILEYKRQTPAQGLRDDQGNLRQLGLEYLRLAQ